ncbi:hypothetical protein CCR95_21435 [Thiocystis minor]|uniref:hypothetical protein n=1 Tax=Thiocystis minor TaxID=61597 RepID=UPI00191133F5|nr:hypothetical protein [Thiocystis minor]MBK5966565.1 hypothetical protein [Thiocystis minor]
MMFRPTSTLVALTLGFVLLAALVQPIAQASRWEVRQEIREGAREVRQEKREARRELRRCESRECARREIREGYREVQREKREARREFRHDDDDRDDRGRDLLKGVAIGAAVVGIATAISRAAQDGN